MAIAYIGGTAATSGVTAVSTLVATYSPTSGNTVVLFLMTNGTTPSLTVQDSAANNLVAGPVIVQGAFRIQVFYVLSSPSGITSYTATWTTNTRSVSITLAEYSGNTGGINTNLTGNTNGNVGTTASLTVQIDEANDFVVGALGSGATLTGTVGNVRQTVGAGSNERQILVDNIGTVTGSNISITGTLSSSNWAAASVELRILSTAQQLFSAPSIGAEYTWGGGDGW